MTTKGHELEAVLVRALEKQFQTASGRSLDDQAIDLVIIGSKALRAPIFEKPVVVQICTRHGDLEKIRDFAKKATEKKFRRLIFVEILTDVISHAIEEALTGAILSAGHQANWKNQIIVFEESGSTFFSLSKVITGYEAWREEKDVRKLHGQLVNWKPNGQKLAQKSAPRAAESRADSSASKRDGYGFLECYLELPQGKGQKPFDGFVSFYVKGEDVDPEVLNLFPETATDLRGLGIEVVFEDHGIASGFSRKQAKSVLKKVVEVAKRQTVSPTPSSSSNPTGTVMTTKRPIDTNLNGLTTEEFALMTQVAALAKYGPHEDPDEIKTLQAWRTAPIEAIKGALSQGLDADGRATEATRQALVSAIEMCGDVPSNLGTRIEHFGKHLFERLTSARPKNPERFAGPRRLLRAVGRWAIYIGGLWFFLVVSSFVSFLLGFVVPSVFCLGYSIVSALLAKPIGAIVEAPVDTALGIVMGLMEKLHLSRQRSEPLAKRAMNFLHDWFFIAGIFGSAGIVTIVAGLPSWSRLLTVLAAIVTLVITSRDARFDFQEEARDDALRQRKYLRRLSTALLVISLFVVPITYSPERHLRLSNEDGGIIFTTNTPVEKHTLVEIFGEEAGASNSPIKFETDGTIYSLEELSAEIPGVTVRAEKHRGRFYYLWRPTIRTKLANFFGFSHSETHQSTEPKAGSTSTPDGSLTSVDFSLPWPWWIWLILTVICAASAAFISTYLEPKRGDPDVHRNLRGFLVFVLALATIACGITSAYKGVGALCNLIVDSRQPPTQILQQPVATPQPEATQPPPPQPTPIVIQPTASPVPAKTTPSKSSGSSTAAKLGRCNHNDLASMRIACLTRVFKEDSHRLTIEFCRGYESAEYQQACLAAVEK